MSVSKVVTPGSRQATRLPPSSRASRMAAAPRAVGVSHRAWPTSAAEDCRIWRYCSTRRCVFPHRAGPTTTVSGWGIGTEFWP